MSKFPCFLAQRCASALLLGAALLVFSAAAQAQQLKLRVLGTTDIHVNLLNYDYYQDKVVDEFGLAKTATLIKAARAEVKNTLLFDNGDLLQGSPLGDVMARGRPGQPGPLQPGQVHPAYKVMNALRYDAANIGNHEFNFGLPFLRTALAGAAFPYVNANIVIDGDGKGDGDGEGKKAGKETGKNAFTPYVILKRQFTDEAGRPHTLRIGVTGFVPPQVMQWDQTHLRGRVQARDIVLTARELIPRIRAQGVDVMVVIPHSGFERGETVFFAENTVARLAEVPGVDAILFGHSHGEFPGRFFNTHPKVNLERGTINGVPAVMPGAWGSHLGVIDLVLDKTPAGWKVSDSRAHLRAIYDREARKPLVEADPQVAQLIREEHEATLAAMRAEVAQTEVPIHSYFAQVTDDPSVQLVAQAQAAYAARALKGTPHEGLPLLSASAPFKSGGRMGTGFYTDIPAGTVMLRHVADLYIYPNTLKVVRLNGAQVREWLEMAAGAFNRIDPAGPAEQMLINSGFPSFNFDSIEGVSYRIDVTQPARYNRAGELVAPEARRIVDMRHKGQPVSDTAEFAVATNNYRASGGGNFPALDGSRTVLDAPDENREAVVQYLRAQQRVNPSADGNWRILPVPGVKLQFISGASGINHLARTPAVRLVKDKGNGSALFELQP